MSKRLLPTRYPITFLLIFLGGFLFLAGEENTEGPETETALPDTVEEEKAVEILYGANMEILKSVVASIGDNVVGNQFLEDGAPLVQGSTPEGLPYYLYGTSCSENGSCLGVEIVTAFQFPGPAFPLDLVNSLNNAYTAVSVSLGQQGKIFITRYVILDYGVARENLELNLQVLQQIAMEIYASLQQMQSQMEAPESEAPAEE